MLLNRRTVGFTPTQRPSKLAGLTKVEGFNSRPCVGWFNASLHRDTFVRGFTIFEMLLVIGMLFFVVMLLYEVTTRTFRNQFFLQEQNEAVEEARKGVSTMVQAIREAADAENGAYPLEEANDFTFVFYSDIDKIGRASCRERV